MGKTRKRKQSIVQSHSGPHTTSTSAQSCRNVIRKFHVLLKKKRRLETEASSSAVVAQVDREIEELGGLEHYQQLSNLGQSKERGGGAEKILINWLKELDMRPKHSQTKLRQVYSLDTFEQIS